MKQKIIRLAEQRLTSHSQFGDSRSLHLSQKRKFLSKLGDLSPHVDAAAKVYGIVAEAPPSVERLLIRDTVINQAVNYAHRCWLPRNMGGVENLTTEFEDSARNIMDELANILIEEREGKISIYELGYMYQVGFDGTYCWIWDETGSRGPLGRLEAYSYDSDRFPRMHGSSPKQRSDIIRSVALLRRLLPNVMNSALSHVHVISLFDGPVAWCNTKSASLSRLPGTIFLNSSYIADHWSCAEYILHEALHQKLYQVCQSSDVLLPDAPSIFSPWNSHGGSGKNNWEPYRVLVAFHVYVHLAVLAFSAENASAYTVKIHGGIGNIIASEVASDRAHYLYDQISMRLLSFLTPTGKELVFWLYSILLDLSVPACSEVITGRHALDLYCRQTAEIANAGHGDKILVNTNKFAYFKSSEVREMRDILSVCDLSNELDNFNFIVNSIAADVTGAAAYCLTRNAIIEIISNILGRGHELESLVNLSFLFSKLVHRSDVRLWTTTACIEALE